MMQAAAAAPMPAAASAPSNARFYGLSDAEANAFVSAPGGGAVSLLFDEFSVKRTGGAPPAGRAPTRRFTLAASPQAAGCRVNFVVKGAALAAGNVRVGTVTLNVDGRATTLHPHADQWTLTARAALSRGERTQVTVALDLPAPEAGGQAVLTVDSVDVSMGRCGGAR